MPIRLHAGAVAVALAAVVAFAPAAFAKEISLGVVLNGKSETPPTTSKGRGVGRIVYDDVSKELRWNVKFAGLTGDATAAHFHGPAEPGQAAGVVIPIKAAPPLLSPIIGSATLTDDQAKALLDGKYYFNIHTQANPGGEIRGQVLKTAKPHKPGKAPAAAPAAAPAKAG